MRRITLSLLILGLFASATVPATAVPLTSPVGAQSLQAASASKNFALQFADATKSTLKAQNLSISPKSASVTYQWLKDGKPIRGAAKATFKFAPADAESAFQLRVVVSAPKAKPVTVTSKAFVPGDQPKEYKLLWADEFDSTSVAGPSLDAWIAQDGDGSAFNLPGWGNNEEQYYQGSLAQVRDGALTIKAVREGASAKRCYYGDCQWLSSKFVTKDKLGFQYGRLEARVRNTTGQGVWPAFWLLGANIDTRSWPGCGEIDIMELKGQEPSKVWGTIHGPNGSIGDVGSLGSVDITGWHTYAIDWTPTSISWFIDGKLFNKVTKREYVGAQDPRVWVFDHEFYLIVNLAMGGNFVGGPSDGELKTAQTDFDYIRYYSLDGLGSLTRH
ncbi:MAG: glycoside hydrolase family 16 protein [Actinomycetales bacterium]|nr:glycoside hydrolase family 16 protein [Actinomycetales bacterium]